MKKDPLIVFKQMVETQIKDVHVRNNFMQWLECSVVEFGHCITVTNEEIRHCGDKLDEALKWKKSALAQQFGQAIFDDCGQTETFETPYGRATNYRVWALRREQA